MTDPANAAPGARPTPPVEPGVPVLIRFLALNLGIGAAVGVACAALVILGDLGGLKGLIASTESPWLALFLLYFMLASTFGSAAMGIAVMALSYDTPEDGES